MAVAGIAVLSDYGLHSPSTCQLILQFYSNISIVVEISRLFYKCTIYGGMQTIPGVASI